MSKSRKHHYLPQYYLKGFKAKAGSSKPKIWQITKAANPKSTLISIKDAACIKDDNSIDLGRGLDTCSIEQLYSKEEKLHSDVIKFITATDLINPKHLIALSRFVSFMHCRVPSYKAQIDRVLQNVLFSTFDLLLKDGKIPPAPEQITNPDGSIEMSVKIDNGYKMSYILYQIEFISTLICNMRFSIIVAPVGHFFITSDNPVVLYNPDISHSKSAGFYSKDVVVSIALSNTHLLMASFDDLPPFIFATPAHTREFNRRCVVMAKSYIFASEFNNEVRNLISKHHKDNAGHHVAAYKHLHGSDLLILANYKPVYPESH